jgi:hypothetical protein
MRRRSYHTIFAESNPSGPPPGVPGFLASPCLGELIRQSKNPQGCGKIKLQPRPCSRNLGQYARTALHSSQDPNETRCPLAGGDVTLHCRDLRWEESACARPCCYSPAFCSGRCRPHRVAGTGSHSTPSAPRHRRSAAAFTGPPPCRSRWPPGPWHLHGPSMGKRFELRALLIWAHCAATAVPRRRESDPRCWPRTA